MKKTIKILALIFIILYVFNSFFFEKMIVGTYFNRNYENGFITDNPHVSDKLVLLDNGTFISRYYGKGKYELYHSLGGTEISLESNSSSIMPFRTSVNRLYFLGNIKIDLYKDLNQYYEKID
jgi:hypothetical protein